ncbi:hypothetical protein CBR_g22015 [Chara braunii]|uniref:WIBG Mago-binding domain-containing protein n=1 Tax=Chara braunii TaxID=69332 RepID=A0A388L1T5_CHABU|nr:hypothetical protein CBR_g22015 [Chara braunii]|eukprot:GBG76267.1 hypothetical protein CBR_g22015 [Chara braunii]
MEDGVGANTDDGLSSAAQGARPLKPGERIIPPSRRPDGSMRKEIRIRAGYTPQDEVARYESKGAIFLKGKPTVPPGYDPVEDAPGRVKSKAAIRNEKRKQKRHEQRNATEGDATERNNGVTSTAAGEKTANNVSSLASSAALSALPSSSSDMAAGIAAEASDSVQPVLRLPGSQRSQSRSAAGQEAANATPQQEGDQSGGTVEIEKKIRALRKKIRQAENLSADDSKTLTAEQKDKVSKLPNWKNEVEELEAQLSSLRVQ